ncbi:UvrD-helicase domain-containing protein [Halopenitus sp. H-Gu1]|uniref:UvrD-helicase domain-containing protein n=1 Tax=Halopenitus sp. H-Gu1 TaxID=3242697 RepID=UPI00359DB9E1
MTKNTDDHVADRREAATGEFRLTKEQAAALELDHNVALTAGAGTGKTTALTERYLHILEAEPEVGPEEIVTITFTNDAANELQDRIRDTIGDRLDDADRESYPRWRTVRDDLEDGYIHTIHGFCARLLREHVVDAPVTPDFEVYDETDAAVLAREVVRQELDDRLEVGDGDVSRLARLWNRATLEDVLVGLIQQRPESDDWANRWRNETPADYVDYVWDDIHPISPSFAEELFAQEEVRTAFAVIRDLKADSVLDDVAPTDDDGADTVETVTRLLDEYDPLNENASSRGRQRFLDDLCAYLTTNEGSRDGRDWKYWGSAGRWSDAGRESDQDRLETAIETLFDTIDPESLEFGVETDRASAHYVLALARLYDGVRDAYEMVKDERNVQDYDDLVETTIGFLEDTPAVRERLRKQFAYVMVDEVQDTDPRQWELVRLLTSDDTEDFDARNVFLVGDEKQSIYRFRGADVTAFADARQELADANPDGVETNRELSGNFRTVEETLQFCNELFDGDGVFDAFGDEYEPFEARPQELTPARESGTDVVGRCEYLLVPDDDHDELHAPGYLEGTPRFTETGEREAYAIAARLTRLLADPPAVYDVDGEKKDDASPEDVTILLRSRTRLTAYERALDEYGVPYTVVSGTGYYDTPEITALLNLLRVLENPNDDIALYGILRSTLFGIPDDELAPLRVVDEDLWRALGNTDSDRVNDDLADAYDCLQRWRQLAGTHPDVSADSTTPWGTLLSRIIDESGYIASVAGDERPRQAAVNVNRFREQVRRWEEAGIKTIAELRSRLELRQDVETHADEATIPEDVDGVQIRTIHSAKGLEFPIVVVPEVGTRFNFGTAVDDDGKVLFDELDVGDDTGTGREPVIGLKTPTPDDAFADEHTLARRVVRERVRRHERAELKRLLYVAATRTRDHLLFSGLHEINEEGDDYRLAEPDDPEEATRWRDWLQPILLDEETTPQQLTTTDAVRNSLGESTYRIRRPEPPIDDWHGDDDSEEPSLRIDIPSPAAHRRTIVVTATDYASMRTGDSVTYLEDAADGDGSAPEKGLSPTTLGTIVHRICETRLDRSRWDQFARDVAKRTGENVLREDLERIETYCERALAFVNDREATLDIVSSRAELSVTARFEQAHVVGDIDHLAITPDAFHVIDYKTNDTSDRSIGELSEQYWPQLDAYAVALHQSDPLRAVELSLYFTDAEESRTRRLEPAELDDLEAIVRSHVSDRTS